jgi:beta-glucanase (GH16 family)
MRRHLLIVATLIMAFAVPACAQSSTPQPGIAEARGWKLVFADEFDDPAKFDELWQVESGSPGHILSSRWPQNVEVRDGLCRLIQRKENRGGKEFTSAHFWSRRQFTYGYYESRYRYAAAPGINNAFWLITNAGTPASKQFEIDINEGHYPSEINTNLHGTSAGKKWAKSKTYTFKDKNLAKDFHTFGLLWTETELVYYFDGKVIRRLPHDNARGPASLRFSTAIMKWAGDITDKIHNTAMEVDYVRVYQPADAPDQSAADPAPAQPAPAP